MVIASNTECLRKARMNAKVMVKCPEILRISGTQKHLMFLVLDEFATITVARFNANSNRANLNCNRNPENSKSNSLDGYASLGIAKVLGHFKFSKSGRRNYEIL